MNKKAYIPHPIYSANRLNTKILAKKNTTMHFEDS